MRKRLTIYALIALLSVFLISCSSALVSYFSYQEFKMNLDERVLQQLLSIKRLKRIQIEDYLKSFLEEESDTSGCKKYSLNNTFIFADSTDNYLIQNLSKIPLKVGLNDLTAEFIENNFTIIHVSKIDSNAYLVRNIATKKIQTILSERTGMGWSGESYLVGSDYKMRTKSRFFSNELPYNLTVNTVGSRASLHGDFGVAIFKDYRNKEVYSAFHDIKISNVHWAILTEIDVEEIYTPLIALKKRLWAICLIIVFVAIILSLVIAYKIANPIRNMSKVLKQMAVGKTEVSFDFSGATREIVEAQKATSQLKDSLNSAIVFAQEIGKMNLDAELGENFKNDALQKALTQMKLQLRDFKEKDEKQQRDSKKMLVQAQEKERARFAKELHDGLGPMLTSLRLMIQTKELSFADQQELKNLLDTIIQEVRNISSNLMPQALVDFGVTQALNSWVDKLNSISNIQIMLDNNLNMDIPSIDIDVQICMFRIIQELINNTLKHAEASKIYVDLSNNDYQIFISYYDNGKGFDVNNNVQGSGLLNIYERAKILSGEVSIQSSEKGTKVEIVLPININL